MEKCVRQVYLEKFIHSAPGSLKGVKKIEIRWFGTAALCITHEDSSLLFDPFVPLNPSLRYATAEELAGMGDIFLTHGHFDHAYNVPLIARLGTGKIHCSPETAVLLTELGVAPERLSPLQPGKVIEYGPFTIKVFLGKHIHFDTMLLVRTLISRRMIGNFRQFRWLMKTHKKFTMGTVLVYQIEAGGKKILHLGSLNLAGEENYPEETDILTLPFQGRSDLDVYALKFVEKIKPKNIYLHHFDDTFPPMSSNVDCSRFVEAVNKAYPELNVVIPDYATPFLV